jgi:hypothetical protein
MGLALIAFTMATPIGSAIAGPIYETVGYYGAYGLACGFNAFAILYVIIFVSETVSKTIHGQSTKGVLWGVGGLPTSGRLPLNPQHPGIFRFFNNFHSNLVSLILSIFVYIGIGKVGKLFFNQGNPLF